ncbi:MAG: cytochrome c3 family protein [Deltaproteobacteria bacterium]|nr:cytochrome c3 family protein [Deltaproteobacteria bacterium]
MKKFFANLILVTGVFALVFGIYQVSLIAGKNAPDSIVIKKYQAKQGAVTFHHAKHAGAKELNVPCKTCHHKMDSEKGKLACTECHKAEKDGNSLSAQDAFHKTCKDGCHKDKKKADPASKAPTACNGCHKK